MRLGFVRCYTPSEWKVEEKDSQDSQDSHDHSPVMVSPDAGATSVKPNDGDIDMATAVLSDAAREDNGIAWNRPKHFTSLEMVGGSSVGVLR